MVYDLLALNAQIVHMLVSLLGLPNGLSMSVLI